MHFHVIMSDTVSDKVPGSLLHPSTQSELSCFKDKEP